tara:strand:+ start:129 stop:335 length:207 start_codon:yes stop_codon:yes gene_type:complete
MMLIAPQECAEMVATAQWVERLIAATDNPIAAVKYLNLRESMRNGGGRLVCDNGLHLTKRNEKRYAVT